jgi:hypothetical protein
MAVDRLNAIEVVGPRTFAAPVVRAAAAAAARTYSLLCTGRLRPPYVKYACIMQVL